MRSLFSLMALEPWCKGFKSFTVEFLVMADNYWVNLLLDTWVRCDHQ